MEEVSAITLISITSFFISFLLAIFLLTVKSKNPISNKLFAIFLILYAIDLSNWFHNLFISELTNFVIAKSLLSYLQMPVLYFYILSVCYKDFKLKSKHFLHIIPFIIGNLVLIPRFYSKNVTEKLLLLEDTIIWELIYIRFSVHIQFIIYIIIFFIILNKYKKIYQQNFSDTASKTYDWLFKFVLFTAIIHFVVIIKTITLYFYEESFLTTVELMLSLLVLFVICWYIFNALKYPELFNPVDSKTEIIISKGSNEPKENTEDVIKLINYMENEKPFLNNSLSIRNLAEKLNVNPRELSILINQHLNQHFFDFVNKYRIDEAMKILKNPSKMELNISEVLYEVGFNSRSSFNTAFKKHTGYTPSEFREAS